MRIHPAIRLTFGALWAGLSALTVVEAPTSLLWLAAIGVTEWGYWLAPVPLLAWLPGWNHSRLGRLGAGLGLAAALLLLSPLVRAALLVQGWPGDLPPFIRDATPRSLDGTDPRRAPVVGADLLLGVSSPEVAKRTVVYGTQDGQPLALDLYQPAGIKAAPGVVMVHGGSWQHGDRGDLAALNWYLAARGYVVRPSVTGWLRSGPFPRRGTTSARPSPS